MQFSGDAYDPVDSFIIIFCFITPLESPESDTPLFVRRYSISSHQMNIMQLFRSSTSQQLSIPRTKLNLGKRAFSVGAPGIWKEFPTTLTLSYSSIWNQNVPHEIPFFIRNQYSVVARMRSNTTTIILRVKI